MTGAWDHSWAAGRAHSGTPAEPGAAKSALEVPQRLPVARPGGSAEVGTPPEPAAVAEAPSWGSTDSSAFRSSEER
eukprot:10822656-Alexandrium_andersonii.AAC.1